MPKFYVKKRIEINGRNYNVGDIVTLDKKPHIKHLEIVDGEKVKESYLTTGPAKISVIITFHNQAEFVKDCLNGFINQNIKQSYEIIAVDDASEDATPELIKQYPNVRYLRVEHHNAPSSRNSGFKISTGQRICFFDGDDIPYPSYLKEHWEKMEERPDADFVYSRFDHDQFGLHLSQLPRCNVFEWSPSWNEYSTVMNTPSMFKRSVVEQCPWNEDLHSYQDADLCIRISKMGFKGVHIRKALWHYRSHHKSVWGGGMITPEMKMKDKKYLKDTYGWPKEPARFTFFSLISRDLPVLTQYFDQIPKLGIPADTHWMLMIDHDDEKTIDKIIKMAQVHAHLFLSFRIFVTNEPNKAYSRSFEERGMRIAGFIKLFVKQCQESLSPTPFLFMVEDDTLAPDGAFEKLWPIINADPKMAYVSGIECGRGGTRHTGVCTLVEDDNGEIIGRKIPSTKHHGVDDIGGGGWYCWIGRIQALKDIEYRCFDGKMLGPDVMMVHDLRQEGWHCKVNWDVPCGHYHPMLERFLGAREGKAYDIDYYQEGVPPKWRMKVTPIKK